jgi:hypothetical protein
LIISKNVSFDNLFHRSLENLSQILFTSWILDNWKFTAVDLNLVSHVDRWQSSWDGVGSDVMACQPLLSLYWFLIYPKAPRVQVTKCLGSYHCNILIFLKFKYRSEWKFSCTLFIHTRVFLFLEIKLQSYVRL